MAGLMSKVFEAAEDETSAAAARGEALGDRMLDLGEEETDSPAGAEQSGDEDAGAEERSDTGEAEIGEEQSTAERDEQSSSSEASASAELQVDVEFTLENETEISYADAEGETSSHSNELTIGTDQEFDAGLNLSSGSAEDLSE